MSGTIDSGGGGGGGGSVFKPISSILYHPPRPGYLYRPRWLPVPVVPLVQPGLLVPTTPVRARPMARWRGAVAGGPPLVIPYRPIAQAPNRPAVQSRGNGRVWMPKGVPLAQPVPLLGLPTGTVIRPIGSPRRLTPGQASLPKALPSSVPPPHSWHITAGGQPTRRGRVSVPSAILPAAPSGAPLRWSVASGLTSRRNGRVWLPNGLAPPPAQPPPLRAMMIALGHPWRAGRVSVPRFAPPGTPANQGPLRGIMASVGHPQRAGRVSVPRFAPPGLPPKYTLPANPIARRHGDDRTRTHAGWLLRWSPAPLFGPALPALGYHIYSNAGSGPINYSTSIATVYGLTWTSGPLAYPDTWMFGVRAFDSGGEEQNLDCAITLILDGSGHDITNRPIAPFGLRAFATAGGGIRAEWSYNVINPTPVPTGFHVYLGTVQTAVLFPVSIVGGTGYASGHRWRSGSVHWRGALGGGMNYATPAATVSFQSAIAGTFVANLAGLSSGALYLIGVRAYNGVAEEPNTSTVTVTADSVGPSAVISLAAIAVA